MSKGYPTRPPPPPDEGIPELVAEGTCIVCKRRAAEHEGLCEVCAEALG